MSTSTLSIGPRGDSLRTRIADYIELTKPRIAVLVLVAVTAAACVARWGRPDLLVLAHTLLGVLLVAGSASAMNQWLERRGDALMKRTAGRPLPAGRVGNSQAIIFALAALAVGLGDLWFAVNARTAFWALVTWTLYTWVYTPLKSRTVLNTTVGAVAGASPMLMGWHATGVSADIRLTALFSMLFLWQFPHFMAIAWIYREQYERAGLRMLTVVDGSGRLAGIQSVSSAVMLLPVSFIPALFLSETGAILYGSAALTLGLVLLMCAATFCARPTEANARLMLRSTLLYLPLTLMLLVFAQFL